MENLTTPEQERRLREVLRGHHREAILTLACVTGMRRDELLCLTWQDIDLSKRELRILNSKTKRDHRVIHCSESVSELLTQHQRSLREAQLEAGQAWSHLDLVFPDHMGGFLKPEQLLKEFDAILEQAELPRIRFHDLRGSHWRKLQAQFRTIEEGPGGV